MKEIRAINDEGNFSHKLANILYHNIDFG